MKVEKWLCGNFDCIQHLNISLLKHNSLFPGQKVSGSQSCYLFLSYGTYWVWLYLMKPEYTFQKHNLRRILFMPDEVHHVHY
jgi:hypothetical protein